MKHYMIAGDEMFDSGPACKPDWNGRTDYWSPDVVRLGNILLTVVEELVTCPKCLDLLREDPKMINIKLTKLSTNPNKLRTNEVIGNTCAMPRIGDRFIMYAEGLEEGIRCVDTSPVTEIQGLIFKTENSTYKLELL